MKFLPSLDLIKKAESGGYAVPSFCVWNAEIMQTVLDAADEMMAPVILMNGPGEFDLLSPNKMGATAHAIAEKYSVPAALHLDHGDSINRVNDCLEAGYTSVMLDYSSKPFVENVEAMKIVIELSRIRGVTVEGELGAIGMVDDISIEGTKASALTDPRDAGLFVNETRVDMLAVSIGNAHGIYSKLPNLDFNLLEEIHSSAGVPLVLHGGSGTPPDDLERAISLGIAKINIASELVQANRDSLLNDWNSGENMWIPSALTKAMKKVSEVVKKWIRITGAAGKG